MGFMENLRAFRIRAGYSSAKDFAKTLGIPYPTYAAYENQHREPKYDLLCKLADILHTTTDDLLGHRITEVPIEECKQVLEAAFGEIDQIIPCRILEATIAHLNDYERLKREQSWIDCPERMGR